MSTALAPGAAAAALVPGDPAGARGLASRLDTYADSAATAAGQLRALDAGGWVGEAAEAFRQALGQVPERLERAVGAFAEAASALRSYASTLEEAQQRAGLALARVEAAEADTAAWRGRLAAHHAALAADAGGGPPAGPAPASHDPGAPGRAAAEDLLKSARADVEAAARAAAERLERAAADAPDEPGFWASAWHAAEQFVAGAAEATVDLGQFAFKLTPTYALIDPDGYAENLIDLGQGLLYGATHPVEFAKAVTNWDLWLDNPARALGQLVPDVVLAVGTAGAGVAARGAGAIGRVARVADDVTVLPKGGRVPDAVSHESKAGSIRHVNPREPGEPGPGSGIPNRYENCVNCSIATDAVLSKNPASALPGLPTATAVIEQAFGRSFRNVASRDAIVSELRVAGNGARGVVHGIRDRGVGHVFNAVNQRGTVRFLDGQTGREASFAGFSRLRFLRTYP